MEKISNLETKFWATVRFVKNLPKDGPVIIDTRTRLDLYGLFKTATEGQNCAPKPPLWMMECRLKWNSWNTFQDHDAKTAMYLYMKKIGDEIRNIYFSGKSEEYLRDADMSFLKKMDAQDIDILFNGILDTDEAEPEVKEEMKRLKNIYLK